jgi:hypothetical protein
MLDSKRSSQERKVTFEGVAETKKKKKKKKKVDVDQLCGFWY